MEATTSANAAVNYDSQQKAPTSVGEWFWTLLLAAIPIVGWIMLFVWAFGGGVNVNKANWAKAMLLWILVVLSFYVMAIVFFGASMLSGMGSDF